MEGRCIPRRNPDEASSPRIKRLTFTDCSAELDAIEIMAADALSRVVNVNTKLVGKSSRAPVDINVPAMSTPPDGSGTLVSALHDRLIVVEKLLIAINQELTHLDQGL